MSTLLDSVRDTLRGVAALEWNLPEPPAGQTREHIAFRTNLQMLRATLGVARKQLGELETKLASEGAQS